MGVSRDTFYRYQELVKDGNVDALINKSRKVPNLKKNRVDAKMLSRTSDCIIFTMRTI